MSKITMDELWENYSFMVKDNKTGRTGSVRIKDFFENVECDHGGGEE